MRLTTKRAKRILIHITIFFELFCVTGEALAQTESLSSPDGRLSIVFETINANQPNSESGQLVYSVSFKNKPLIDRSNLSLQFQNQNPLGQSVKIVKTKKTTVDQSYKLIAGKTSWVDEQYNAISINLKGTENSNHKLSIEARAYNDAVAFRYIVPKPIGEKEFRLRSENTEFRISKDAITYALILPGFKSSYESDFVKLPMSSFAPKGSGFCNSLIGLPLLMEVPGVAWISINEADLKGYSSMYLTNLNNWWGGHWLKALLAPQIEDTSVCVTGQFPFNSPWRILQVGNEPKDLMESNALTNLNPKPVIEETAWIKPGKSAWNWWSGSLNAKGIKEFSTENMKYYVDFAAKSGFKYMLIDAGWAVKDDITRMNGRVDIPEVVAYAKSKNVKIWIWLHFDDAVRQMDEAFPLYEKWGVAGLKIDFIERDDQKGVEFYYRAAEKAAQHHLMLDFHGSTKPSGLSRTYPNIMGYEGVLGMEVSHGGLRDNPDLHVMLPFTRMLGGFMDYTPGGFNNVTLEEFEPLNTNTMVMGTRAHHLAMYVVYEVPFQMVSDHPAAYQGQASFQFIKDVPATWDETKVLNGIPGKYVTIARRSKDEWYLGSITNWTARQFELPLNFLGEGKYLAEIYKDASDSDHFPKKCIIQKERVTKNQLLKIELASGGGVAVRFKPVN